MDSDEMALRRTVIEIAIDNLIDQQATAERKRKGAEDQLQSLLQQECTPEQRMTALEEYKQSLLNLSRVEKRLRAAKRMIGELEEAETE